ncbi:MAG: alpha/beta hydrolase family protein [Myxococcaceae bacterium]
MRPIEFVFEADDGRPLGGTALEPARVQGAVVIASATGVPRRIYAGLARHLADAGLAVLTFDYRGIGDSRRGPLRRESGRMQDWGRLDLEGALAWMRQQHPCVPQLVLGHSAGGQLVGLAPSARHLSGAALVGSQLGWAGHWPWPWRGLMWAAWHALIPGITSVAGFPPMRALGQGEDLAAGVAREWARWGRRRHYLFDDLGAEARAAYAALRFPVRALHIADDLYAPRSGVEALVAFYGGAREVHTVRPEEVGERRIGHFGWVRPPCERGIWAPIRDWFLGRLEPGRRSRSA